MEGHVDGQVIIQQDFNKLKTKLQEARAQIAGHQRKQMRHNDKISLAHFRISTLELIIEDIQATILDPYDLQLSIIQPLDVCNESSIPLPQAHIAPPTVLPPSPALPLSPMFDPHDFFLPKEILPPRKQAHFLSLSSTDLSAQPKAFEIGENYHDAQDTSHTRHKEQIKDILNHLDELSL
nr:hypothetical protein [Tanacetum cinerariifolium]